MNINVKSVVIDIAILFALTFIGGFIAGAAAGQNPSVGSIFVASFLMLTIGFCISGCKNLVGRWKHLLTVAIFYWLIDAGIQGLFFSSASRLLTLLVLVLITMGTGGALSFLFVRTTKQAAKEDDHKETEQENG